MTMTRRAALSATLALAPIPALASFAPSDDGAAPTDHAAAVKSRLAQVVEAFSRDLWIYGGAMPAADRDALLALDAATLNAAEDATLALLDRYGVSLDWLWTGDMGALLNKARIGDAYPIPDSFTDPAFPAADRWRKSVVGLRAFFDRSSPEDDPEGEAAVFAEYGEALDTFAETRAETFAGLSLQLRAALEGIADIRPGATRDPAAWTPEDFNLPDCHEPAASFRTVWRAIETLDRWTAQADETGLVAGRAQA